MAAASQAEKVFKLGGVGRELKTVPLTFSGRRKKKNEFLETMKKLNK
jgi:hypothetical protein